LVANRHAKLTAILTILHFTIAFKIMRPKFLKFKSPNFSCNILSSMKAKARNFQSEGSYRKAGKAGCVR
jgi:hypothetical protein